jgi:hypothetical protein
MNEVEATGRVINSLDDLASVATIVGGLSIVAVLWQIGQQSAIARSTFEHLFVAQYQQLIQRLPINALLGRELSDDERRQYIQEFYHYIDLCNTQANHHAKRRITKAAWTEWREGIEANFARKEIDLVWSFVAAKSPDEFVNLRRVVSPSPFGGTNPYRRIN